ncbi:MAG: UDP-N-acetylmuramate dehydrogenase [Planctomycetota bacterium]|nr:MAG: UDP-N-acetylmuramate dehydrogenase [Planctomycetota bacterium]
MSWWNDFADRTALDVPLAPMTWFRLGGRARYVFHPSDADDLSRFLRRALDASVPVKVLGSGANVLVSDEGFDGAVVRLDRGSFKTIRYREGAVETGAGVELMPLSRTCSERGLAGLEGLAGIPASMGGAVRMNAGGRFGEIGEVVRRVEVVTPQGDRKTIEGRALGFGYRTSALNGAIVVRVELQLRPDDPERVRARYEECFAYKQASQPMAEHSAGCIFKNPPGASAGRLIERAGLKGTACGRARVSERHANFIVADRGATAADVLRLIDLVRRRVEEAFGVELETEIDIWRPSGSREAAACP